MAQVPAISDDDMVCGGKVIMQKLSDNVYYYRFNEDHDWPNLGYVCGDKHALAIDAGFSSSHAGSFYAALRDEGLRLPDFTVITHWHWDHTLAMGKINGVSIANRKTCSLLRQESIRLKDDRYLSKLKRSYVYIATEFPDGDIPEMIPADISFTGELSIDLGGLEVQILQAESTHTDDSTLVYVPSSGILFIGDAAYANSLSGPLDGKKQKSFIKTVRDLDSRIIVDGHQMPMETEDYLASTCEPIGNAD
jgi:glyoxylase-like metal-dependent hydrolase (beta-lactamase superfamily II)